VLPESPSVSCRDCRRLRRGWSRQGLSMGPAPSWAAEVPRGAGVC